MSDETRPADRTPGEPEFRAALLAEAIRHTVCLEGPTTVTALFDHLRRWSGLKEEEAGCDLYTVVFLLMRSKFYETNHHNPIENSYAIGLGTTITPSPIVTTYIHAGTTRIDEDEEA